MTRLPRVSGQEVLRILLGNGYLLSHSRGSHHYLRRPEGQTLVTVPVHGNRTLPVKTLRSILRQADLTPEEFTRLYHGK